MIAPGEDLQGGFRSMMQQKFGPPVKHIRFARIQIRGALLLAHSLQRIAQFLLHIAEQMMELGAVIMRDQG